MMLIANLDAAVAGYTVTCRRVEEGERLFLRTATHWVTLERAGVTVCSYQTPAGSDACALARARSIVDLIGSGLLEPEPTSRKAIKEARFLWCHVAFMAAGEVPLTAFP